MKKRIITGLVIASLAATSLAAFGPHHEGKGFKHGLNMGKIFRQLDLTDEQKESFKTLRDSQKSQRKAFRDEMIANRDVESIFTEHGFDKTKFISKATEAFQKRIQMRADFIEKAYTILDENQRAELKTKMQEMRAQRGK